MNEPTHIQRHITLVTSEPLDNDVVKLWFRTVRENAPDGVPFAVQVGRNDGLRSASLVHREHDGRQEYIIPLTRDLTDKEGERIVQAWDAAFPDGDFSIEMSTQSSEGGHETIDMPSDDYLSMCLDLARRQHQDWMRERTSAGWRYGTTLSLKNKTHPLLRPWDDLPAKYRKIDQDTPNRLLDLLNDHGYAVIRRGELDSLLRLMRRIA